MGSIYNLEKIIDEVFVMANNDRLHHSQLIDLQIAYGVED